MSEKYLNRIASLLAQAESTPFGPERDLAMTKAIELSRATSISIEVARRHQADKTKRKTPVVKMIVIGERGTRHLPAYIELFDAVASPNDVKVDIASDNTCVWAYGFATDIEMVELLYASLVVQMVQECQAYLDSGEYKKELVTMPKWGWEERWSKKYQDWRQTEVIVGYVEKPVHGTVARGKFMEAYADKIRARLFEAKREMERAQAEEMVEVVNEAGETVTTSTALVLSSKAVEVKDFYKSKSNAKGSWAGSQATGYSRSSANAGHSAAARANLGGQRSIGS